MLDEKWLLVLLEPAELVSDVVRVFVEKVGVEMDKVLVLNELSPLVPTECGVFEVLVLDSLLSLEPVISSLTVVPVVNQV